MKENKVIQSVFSSDEQGLGRCNSMEVANG